MKKTEKTFRIIFTFVLTLIVALSALGMHGYAAEAPRYDTELANQVVELVNEVRAQKNLNPVILDTEIVKAAEIRAKEQEILYSHSRPDGSAFYTVFDQCKIKTRIEGENLGSSAPCKAEQIMKAWINSPTHAANLFDPDFTRIGVACYISNGTYYWTQLFAG